MKIGVLSDIHSNIVAFKAVITELKKEGITEFIIAGDHICDGPGPNEVIDEIKSLSSYCIRGNRENYILDMHKNGVEEWEKHKQVSAIVWTYKELSKSSIDFLENLEEKMYIDINGEKIKIVHGSPNDVYEHLYPHDEEQLNMYTDGLKASVLVTGHTHHAFIKTVNDVLIINPGSVGLSFKDPFTSEYGIIEYRDKKWSGELKTIKYDGIVLKKIFEEKNLFENIGIWSKLIYSSLRDSKNYNSEFVNKAKQKMKVNGKFISNECWDEAEKEMEII